MVTGDMATGSFEDWLSRPTTADLYDHTTSTQIWSVIGGHLVLSSVGQEDITQSLNFYVRHKTAEYFITLVPFDPSAATSIISEDALTARAIVASLISAL